MERDHVIAIDVGGRVFKVLRPTIMKYPESTLALVLAGKDLQNLVIVDKTYFFDRNPDYFAVVLDYMRNGKLFLPPNLSREQMTAEAVYWKMTGLLKELQGGRPAAMTKTPAPVTDTPPLPDLAATPPLNADTPPLEPAVAPMQYAPTLLLDEPQKPPTPAATLLLDQPPAATLLLDPAPNYQATLLLDPMTRYQPKTAAAPAPIIAPTLLLDDPKKNMPAPTLLLDDGPKYAPTLLLDDHIRPPAPSSPSMFDDPKPVIAPTLILEEPLRAAPRHPLKAHPPPAIQPTLLLQDPSPGTPELPSTPKLTDDEVPQNKPTPKVARHKEEVKAPPKPPQKDDDLLGSLVKAQDQGPARALPFGGGGQPAGKKEKAPPRQLKRRKDSESEGSNKVDEQYESSFIDDSSEDSSSSSDAEVAYKPKKKTKKEPKKKPAVKKGRKRRGSEEIPAKQPAMVILLSGLTDKERKAMETVIERLGGTVADSFDQGPSHLVMPEFKRNVKLLVALCKGVALVRTAWIQDSQRQGKWLDSANYPLCTPAVEAAHRFRYADTAQRAKTQGMS